jgi:multidrug transporter EmrE-like cation transporter
MSHRYLKLSRHHAFTGSAAALAGVLATTACFVNAVSERPAWAIMAGCGVALCAFAAALEFCESVRCLRIAARWNKWDQQVLPPQDPLLRL